MFTREGPEKLPSLPITPLIEGTKGVGQQPIRTYFFRKWARGSVPIHPTITPKSAAPLEGHVGLLDALVALPLTLERAVEDRDVPHSAPVLALLSASTVLGGLPCRMLARAQWRTSWVAWRVAWRVWSPALGWCSGGTARARGRGRSAQGQLQVSAGGG